VEEGSQWRANESERGHWSVKYFLEPCKGGRSPGVPSGRRRLFSDRPVAAHLRWRSGARHWLPSSVPPGLAGRLRV